MTREITPEERWAKTSRDLAIGFALQLIMGIALFLLLLMSWPRLNIARLVTSIAMMMFVYFTAKGMRLAWEDWRKWKQRNAAARARSK